MILNIVGKSNGVGLARDLSLLATALGDCGYEVRITRIDKQQSRRRRSLWVQLLARCRLLCAGARRRAAAPVDVNLMLEHVWPQHLPQARCNVLIPNPEWFDSHDARMLSHVDAVWAKTEYTQCLFRERHPHTAYVGFNSEDRYDGSVIRQPRFFHLAGKSHMKGTDRLLRVWARHPEWPVLTLIQHFREAHVPEIVADNIDRRIGYVDDGELRSLQNASRFHLCLSLTEGWGHYIAEALSVGAITVTLDAPPMNELVTPQRGILVGYAGTGRQRLATTYFFDEGQLEAAINGALALTQAQCQVLSDASRDWYLRNRQSFAERLRVALQELPLLKAPEPPGVTQAV